MTDKEIMMDLNRLIRLGDSTVRKEYGVIINKQTLKEVLSLISRISEEISVRDKLLAKANTKIERLTDNLNSALAEVRETEAEYEKVYEQAYNDARANLVDGGASCRLCMAAIESKAQKEFAESLKGAFCSMCEYYGDDIKDVINSFLKESKYTNITKCGLCNNWHPAGHCKLIGPHIHKKYSDFCSSGIPREVKNDL